MMGSYGLVIGAVTELIVTVVALLFLGRWVDHRFSTGSLWMLIGTTLGFVGGVVRMTLRLKGVMSGKDSSD